MTDTNLPTETPETDGAEDQEWMTRRREEMAAFQSHANALSRTNLDLVANASD
jgi:hypothetical protein